MTAAPESASTPTEEEIAAAVEAEEAARVQAEAAAAEAANADLGDAGKKAIDRMKAERAAAKKEAADAKAERDALQAKLDGKEAEHEAAQAAQKVRDEALAAANDRIKKSEVKAAAKGVLADPADAFKFLDLDAFEVGDDGNVDESAIKAALDELVANKPYLGVTQGDAKRFQGTADGGPKGSAGKPQLTRSDLKTMSPDAVLKAKAEGRMNTLLGIT